MKFNLFIILLVLISPVVVFADDAIDAKAAAVEFFRALSTGDQKSVDGHFAGDVGEQTLLSIFRDLIQGSAALRTACIQKFGDEASKQGIDTFNPANMASDIEKFDTHVDGDTAHLQRPGVQDDSLVMKKIGGAWKITSLTGSPGRTAQLGAFMKQFTPVLKETADEVNAGKYKTTLEVQAAFVKKRQAALQAWMAKQIAPSTHPSP